MFFGYTSVCPYALRYARDVSYNEYLHEETDLDVLNNLTKFVREDKIPEASRTPSCVVLRHEHSSFLTPPKATTYISLALPVAVEDVDFSTFVKSMTKIQSIWCVNITKVPNVSLLQLVTFELHLLSLLK